MTMCIVLQLDFIDKEKAKHHGKPAVLLFCFLFLLTFVLVLQPRRMPTVLSLENIEALLTVRT
jgi:hypothetical protein